MNQKPLTKEMFEQGITKSPLCLGEAMVMSVLVDGVRELGPCAICYDWRACKRNRVGLEADPYLPVLTEDVT